MILRVTGIYLVKSRSALLPWMRRWHVVQLRNRGSAILCEGDCSATASGGTGVYESWDWYGAEEIWDEGGTYSFADANDCVPGSVMQVAARVTDSSGASALGERLIFCPN